MKKPALPYLLQDGRTGSVTLHEESYNVLSRTSIDISRGDERRKRNYFVGDTKRGGLVPASDEAAVSTSGNAGDFFKSDTDAIWTTSGKTEGKLPAQYSTLQQRWHSYATIPVNGHMWLTPECEHTEDSPWCQQMDCRCHFDQERMERYFIQAIERGDLSIAEAIDLYHCESGYMARKQAEVLDRLAVLV